MIRSLMIGMALVAALATSAIGAAAAGAASSLDLGASPAFVTGTQAVQNKFTITGANESEVITTFKCATANLQGTTTGANLTELTLTPGFGGEAKTCELGGLAASVKLNGCTYTLTNTATALAWTTDVVCPSGKAVEFVQGTCILSIASQTGIGTITFANAAGPPKHVTAILNLKNIGMTGGLGCPANFQGLHMADVAGTQTIKAFKDEAGAEGAQVNLEAT